MSDRTGKSRSAKSCRRAPCPAAALMLAGLLLAAPGTAAGQAEGPAGTDERPNSKVSAKPVEPPKPPETESDAAGQGIAVAEGVEAGIREAFAQLADADAEVREEARLRLMALERRYLPALQKLVERNRPLLPPQAAVIREIVTHVYLTGEPYNGDGRYGFLGVRMTDADMTQQLPPAAGEDDALAPGAEAAPEEPEPQAFIPDGASFRAPPRGVVIVERFAGFAGYRAFLDGDIVVGLADDPGRTFGSAEEFGAAVRTVGAGGKVRFTVLRRGRLVKVEARLDPRPDAANMVDPSMNDLDRHRRLKAEAYWNESFGPLLNERVG